MGPFVSCEKNKVCEHGPWFWERDLIVLQCAQLGISFVKGEENRSWGRNGTGGKGSKQRTNEILFCTNKQFRKGAKEWYRNNDFFATIQRLYFQSCATSISEL